MRFKLLTLLDITETKVTRGPDKLAVHQQANYNTVIQTIGLRVNPVPLSVVKKQDDAKLLGFGSNFKSIHTYWEFEFEIEYKGGLDTEMLINDFNLVPVITGLNETAKINISVFDTKDVKRKNIIFKHTDKNV